MSQSPLKDLLHSSLNAIVRELIGSLNKMPESPYKDFIVRSKEGRRRVKIWVNLMIGSLDGRVEDFFRDQERTGYARAVQGYKFEDVSCVYLFSKEIINNLIRKSSKEDNSQIYTDYPDLSKHLMDAYHIIATSYLKTHEQIINEKISHLEELYHFTQKIIATLELDDILNILLRKVKSLIEARKIYYVLYRENKTIGVFSYPKTTVNPKLLSIIEKAHEKAVSIFVNESGHIEQNIDRFTLKRFVVVPVIVHKNCYGVLALENGRGFTFTQKELNLLNQFLYITAIALENALLFNETEINHEQLRVLNERLITIQEEERKRLASDIHDSVTQALTAIGYKLEVCKEIAQKDIASLQDNLDDLHKIVRKTIGKSRKMISSLRPDLIDNIGLVAALRNYFNTYTDETNIKVLSHLPKQCQLPSKVKICIFRVVQEALSNVFKHASTMRVNVSLRKTGGDVILTVIDAGRGFDVSSENTWLHSPDKLGLLSMRERIEAVNGTLLIHSRAGEGCRIEAKIPIKNRG